MEDILLAYQEGSIAFDKVVQEARDIIEISISKFRIKKLDTEDKRQIALVGLWEAAKSYKPNSNKSAKSYIYMVIKRALIRTHERLGRIKRKAYQEATYLEKPLFDNSNFRLLDMIEFNDDPTEKLKLEDLNRLCEDKLTDLEKQVFKLRSKGYSYQETADKIGRTFKSVDNALYRIKNKIDIKEVI